MVLASTIVVLVLESLDQVGKRKVEVMWGSGVDPRAGAQFRSTRPRKSRRASAGAAGGTLRTQSAASQTIPSDPPKTGQEAALRTRVETSEEVLTRFRSSTRVRVHPTTV